MDQKDGRNDRLMTSSACGTSWRPHPRTLLSVKTLYEHVPEHAWIVTRQKNRGSPRSIVEVAYRDF